MESPDFRPRHTPARSVRKHVPQLHCQVGPAQLSDNAEADAEPGWSQHTFSAEVLQLGVKVGGDCG